LTAAWRGCYDSAASSHVSDRLSQPIAIAVVCHQGRYLVGRRPEGVPLAGLWEFPGGKPEPEETLAAAAVRECREEVGLEVEVTGEFPPVTHTYAHGAVELHFFACRLLGPSQEPQAPFRWADRSELGRLAFPAANRSIVEELLAGGR
jgi:mutator protein MutT